MRRAVRGLPLEVTQGGSVCVIQLEREQYLGSAGTRNGPGAPDPIQIPVLKCQCDWKIPPLWSARDLSSGALSQEVVPELS